jgi:hypothetical protein
VSACVPNNNEDDVNLVRKFMLHSNHPSNIINHEAPDANHPLKYCKRWKDEARVCRFGYPKPLQQQTEINDAGHVLYTRVTEQDRRVVPYCLPLLRKFQCHMNFEIAGSAHLFQYLFKYVHKGMLTID